MAAGNFPERFLWGAATASYQVEGGIEDCDWAEAARQGRVPPCGNACDHYHRFEEDLDIAKSLGHNCHRFSIEWARIEPEEGKFDEREIAHYRAVLQALRARKLEPFVTIWHFTLPLWFAQSGGFERKDAPEIFARYCAHVVGKIGDLCTHFSTINEPMVYVSNGWRRGTWPPFRKWPFIDAFHIVRTPGENALNPRAVTQWKNIIRYITVFHRVARAHNAAYDAIKKIQPNAEVGPVVNVILFHADRNPLNRFFAWVMNIHWTRYFMFLVRGKYDVVGLNYYVHHKFGDTSVYDKTDMGWEVYPEGLCGALTLIARYKKPIYVSEAGVADAQDRIRASYIRSLVRCMRLSIEEGVDLRGYMYWSLLDNYEWAEGFTKRFGLVDVDYKTLARTIRPSAYVYKEIIERNGGVHPVR